MSAKTQISVDFSSQGEEAFPFLNPLDGLEQLLTMHRTKKAQTPMEVETLPKLDTMITTEMVINGSDADSHNLLEIARAMGLQFAGINFDQFPRE